MSKYEDIQTTLAKRGVNIVNKDIYNMMAIWKSWYIGNVDKFHYYSAKLASGKEIQCERLTMNIPKKVCEDFSKLLWSEKVTINLDSPAKTKQLWEILDSKENNFSIMFPQVIEKSFALGTGVLVEYLDNDKTIIEYIDGDKVIPYKFTNSYIYGFITLNSFVEKDDKENMYYTHITFHEFDGRFYYKKNELYMSKDSSLLGNEVSFKAKFPNVTNPVIYKTNVPHFQIIKPAIANNYDLDTPMGLSIYANAIDKFKAIDIKYDSFMKEFKLGKKRILVDRGAVKTAAQVQADGSIANVSFFDADDEAYQAINGMESQPIKEIDFKLRHKEHIESINADLNYISSSVGLGQNYYDFSQDGTKTATEVISENSDTYRTKEHHQMVIKDVVLDLVNVVMFLNGLTSSTIDIEFDDSIIQNKDAKIDTGLKLLNAGIISKRTFLKDYLEYDDVQIEQELADMKEENKVIMPQSVDFFSGNTEEEDTETE